MADKQNNKERLKEITDSIETGIMELFESDKYKSYLQTMSRFHKYSVNNTLLISMQKPDATLVAGFNKWRDGFTRFVKKGEKGIKIIAPTPYKIKEEREKLDPQTKAPLLDTSGKVQTEEVEIQIPMYRVVSVFDVSQTEGEPLPTLASDLTGNVKQFDASAENSLGYIATWSKGKELAELRASLETINKTSSELISGIDKHFAEIIKERGIDLTVETSVPELAPTPDSKQISENSSHIEVEGHLGTWYVIDTDVVNDTRYFLLEHEQHGDDAACVIVDGDGKPVLDDVWNGFDDLQYYFDSLEVTAPVSSEDRKPPFDVMEFSEPQWEQIKMGWDNDLDVSAYANPALSAEQMQEIRTSLGNSTPLHEPPLEERTQPMPDPMVSIDDRNAYGYTADELLPLSKERATELFEQDLTVYLLYEDNTEAMAFDRADIDNHDGLFGIEKADWTALQELEEIKGDSKLTSEMREQLFLEKGKDAYAIYQLKDGAELRDYRFEGMDWITSKGLSVERENYNLVYTDTFSKFSGTRDRLEELWDRFNNDHPADFRGHSLSVSDIVAIKKSNVVSYHYCDSFDFVELPKFAERLPDSFLTGEKIDTPRGSFLLTTMTREQIQQAGYGYHHTSEDSAYRIMANGTRAFAIVNEDNPLRTSELSTEQSYNQIDGIINNQPTVAQLEQDAKSGKPISLMDLLDATRREEKQSVMEQLKTKPPQDSKKEKTAPSKGAEMER